MTFTPQRLSRRRHLGRRSFLVALALFLPASASASMNCDTHGLPLMAAPFAPGQPADRLESIQPGSGACPHCLPRHCAASACGASAVSMVPTPVPATIPVAASLGIRARAWQPRPGLGTPPPTPPP